MLQKFLGSRYLLRLLTLGVVTTMLTASLLGMCLPAYALDDNLHPSYVAFGDSITTGSSIATCVDDRGQSPWGCTENPTAATPYPDLVAQGLRLTYSDNPHDYLPQARLRPNLGLYRAGIWGYTIQEAIQALRSGRDSQGTWITQLDAVKRANRLVTGSLGINDMHFSDVAKWARLYFQPGGDHVTAAALAILQTRSQDFDTLFKLLQATQENGARVIIGLYYNPYDSDVDGCDQLRDIGDRIVGALDDNLLQRSHRAGFSVADFRRPFTGHGAGSSQSYVFGSQCTIGAVAKTWLNSILRRTNFKTDLGMAYDPHPNSAGTRAMANMILQEYNGAD